MARLGRKRATLSEFLDYQREALIGRLHGLTVDQAPVTPTGHADIIRETIDGTRGS